jgi:hypothetical protein
MAGVFLNVAFIVLFIVLFIAVCAVPSAVASDYTTRLQREIGTCDQIDPDEYQSGLYNNPEGYRAFYKQSACIQRVAIAYRDIELCDRVRRRYGLFNSSWGYSESNCEALVKKGEQEDRTELLANRERYLEGPVVLTALAVERNGNRRDYDFIPAFRDGYQAGYSLEIWLTDDVGKSHQLLSHGSYLKGESDDIRIFRRKHELESRFRGLQIGIPYELQARLILSIGIGRPGHWLRDDLLEEVFPASERTQTLNIKAVF